MEFSSADGFGDSHTHTPWHSSELRPKRHSTPQKRSRSKDKKLNQTSERRKVGKSPNDFDKNRNTVEKMVEEFIGRDNLDTLDLSSYNLSDSEIIDVLSYLRPLKKIKGLKLVKNSLTNEGVGRLM